MERRISAHKDTWEQLSENDRQRLRRGQVLVGDTEEMVRIALGPPDRVQQITAPDGQRQTVWLYEILESGGDYFLNGTGTPSRVTSSERNVNFRNGIVINQRRPAIQVASDMMEARLDHLVSLSPGQRAQAHAIFEQANTELFAFGPEERPEKGMPIRRKMRADIRSILTPAQKAKYDDAPQYLGGGSTRPRA